MRRIILITLGLIFGATGLLALYVVWDYDPDDVSPTVEAPSYRATFEAAVRQHGGVDFDRLSDDRKATVLAELVGKKNAMPVREVAVYELRTIADKGAAIRIIRSNLPTLPPDLYEVAIGSAAALGTPAAQSVLDSLYMALRTDPASHVPLGSYRQSSLRLSEQGDDIVARFEERSRNDADYSQAKASEITYFFPTDPEYFLSIPNSDDILERFRESRFTTSLEGSPVPDDAWSLPLLRTIAALRERLSDKLGFMAPYFSPERLFRDNLSIGKYGENYLLVSFKDKNLTVAETLIGIFETLGNDFGIRKIDTVGTTISCVESKKTGRTLCYATLDDYFIVATNVQLMTQSLRTFARDRNGSLGIDPLFAREYLTVDQSGKEDLLFAWFNPTQYFDMVGADRETARRFAIVARATGRPVIDETPDDGSAGQIADVPGIFAWMNAGGEDPARLWRYIVDVRSVGRNPLDSLAKLSHVDIGSAIVPYLLPNAAVGYAGVDYLREEYGYSNTAFDLVTAFPLRQPPAGFDSTLRIFFGRTTSLVYSPEELPAPGNRLWIATDTATNDSVLLARKFQPSFGVIGNRVLLVATTPELLRRTATEFVARSQRRPMGPTFLTGSIAVDSFANNADAYLKRYLARGGRYTPQEISRRLDPLARALGLYDQIRWGFNVNNGLRHGEIRLLGKKSG